MSSGRIGDALAWFSFALGDLAAGRIQSGGHIKPRIIAFRANQAARNALKAALVLMGIDRPRKGDLAELGRALPTTLAKRTHPDLAALSRFGPDIAYPGTGPPVSPLESADARSSSWASSRRTAS